MASPSRRRVGLQAMGQYSRRIWFLYEWLMDIKLPIEDLKSGNFVPLIDEKLQFATSVTTNSSRHRIRNNLPGTVDFCPLIFKTEKLSWTLLNGKKHQIIM